MKHILLTALLPFLLITNAWAISGDTLQITSHDAITVVTDPSKGANTYTEWAVFPSKEEAVRKIVMKIKFACPDNMRCADWDYLDHVTLKRTEGVNGEVKDFEIGRMLTPYGGAFGKDWEFDWQVDVTDFSLLLRDSVELEYKHTGYEPNNDRGWKVTVAFDIIKGQPAMEPVSITKIYNGSFAYGDKENPIEEALVPVRFAPEQEAALGRLRIIQTGHGMDRPDGCGEFCNKFRDFLLDEKLVASRQIWKQCGENPLYPQAGTWIFDRANWCPGDLIQPDLYDFALTKSVHTVQLKMENYSSPKPSANELIAAYLIQYKPYQKKHDVAIEDIIIPSDKAIHSRINPATFAPTIVIKNNGAVPLTSLAINHGTTGQKPNKFSWNGSLQPGEIDTISIPGLIPQEGMLAYHFELDRPNGNKDAFKKDNQMSSNYSRTAIHGSELIFHLETNRASEDNGYQVIDAYDNVVYERTVGTLVADTTYKDTLKLSNGAYQLHLLDEGGDGLEFWYKTKAGRGKSILLNHEGKIVKSFDSDFGSSITYNFTVGDNPDPIKENEISLGVFPTRTKDFTYFDFLSNNPEEVVIKLVKDPGGEVVEEHHYSNFKEGRLTFDLSRYPKSRYFFRVFVKDKVVYNKRVRVKE
ncbi:peptide-N-glycosidase F-related protein [uncultured Cyclobacterium sp.]|uniref:peptide-N-glycosidase F-related protein n=1 Tax=uncultured Cyclobacterium sp. TaxID=453820 RepID=UPI0030EF90A5|tara:strand:- start:69346 stop:71265 length:1920 start_codon:yes stop_codon:yes gene_type:complete